MGASFLKPPLEPMQWVRNGKYPDATFAAELAERTNFVARHQLKEVARFCSNLQSIASAGGSGERVRWRAAFRSSPYATAYMAKAWIAPTTTELSTGPYVRVRIQDGTPTTLGDASLGFGGTTGSPTVAPNTCSALTTFVASSPGTIAVPTGSTEYYLTVSDFDEARCVAVSVYEVSLNASDQVDEGIAALTPIYDADRQDVATVLRAAWRYAGAHLFNWSVDTDGGARTRSSATDINVIDNSSTSVSAASPGFTLDLRYKTTKRRTTVPVTFKAYCSVSAGSGGTIKIKDSGGTAVATLSSAGAGGAGWFTTTANLPATSAKYDLTYSCDGINTLTLYALSCYQDAP